MERVICFTSGCRRRGPRGEPAKDAGNHRPSHEASVWRDFVDVDDLRRARRMFSEGANERGFICVYARPRLMWADSTRATKKSRKGDVIQINGDDRETVGQDHQRQCRRPGGTGAA
jgi:hypothetical protein